jgi:hypothetical protein
MIQNIFVVSLLSGDMKLYNLAIENLENISFELKKYPSAFSQAIKIVMMDKKGLVALRGSENRISELQNIKKDIGYPFLYILKTDENVLFF